MWAKNKRIGVFEFAPRGSLGKAEIPFVDDVPRGVAIVFAPKRKLTCRVERMWLGVSQQTRLVYKIDDDFQTISRIGDWRALHLCCVCGAARLKKCGDCHRADKPAVYYCDTVCQRYHWGVLKHRDQHAA